MNRIYGAGILKSMRIAFRNFMRPPITVQYPHEKVQLPERARWAVAMKPDDDGNHKCTGCFACERACPDYIIQIELTTAEDRSKHIDHWRYEIGACMMCGLCVEACPYDAILMSHDYELARTDPSTLRVELLTDVPAVAIKRRTAEAGSAPAGASAAASATAASAAAGAKPAAGAKLTADAEPLGTDAPPAAGAAAPPADPQGGE